jgi:hypothetical protein
MRISEQDLKSWTLPTHYQEGVAWFEAGRVEHWTESEGKFEARLSIRDRSQICRFRVDDSGRCTNDCPCRISRQEGLICGHVIAVMLAWRAENADPHEERLARIDKLMSVAPERRRHFRKVADSGIPAMLHLSFRQNWTQEVLKNSVHLIPTVELENRIRRPDQLHPNQALKLSESDQRLLALLEDITGSPLQSVFQIDNADLVQVLNQHAPGQIRILDWAVPLQLNTKVVLPMLTVDLNRESGECTVSMQMDLPKAPPAGSSPLLLLSAKSGWVISGDQAWPMESVPPRELQGLVAGPIRIPRHRVMPFLKEELPKLEEKMLVDNRVPFEDFKEANVPPAFHLELKGGLQFVSGVLHARYGEVQVIAGGPDPGRVCALPDPSDPLAYGGRNPDAETEALKRLRNFGFAASSGDRLGTIEGQTPILNLLSRVRFELEPLGWQVDLRGNLESVAAKAGMLLAQIKLESADTPDWFNLTLSLRDTQGQTLTEGALRKALDQGKEYLEVGDSIVLLPIRQTEAIVDTVSEARPGPDGTLRVAKRSCGYVQSRLTSAEGIPVEADTSWMEEAAQQNQEVSLEPVDLPPALRDILRPYQDIGVRWLRLMEKGGFGGILGDDMGLGKTLQTLAWLSLERSHPDYRGKPALVVCPSSLVENWAEEAQKFIPDFKVLPISGSKRAPLWEQAADHNLVIVSYGMLRRDSTLASAISWSVVALDEAQHIKNPGTQNALAAKKLSAGCRLVLTGTPMENQVRDLWSMMDFLMPGYLGTAAAFKKRFGTVIDSGGPGAATAMHLLRRKLKPFLLRRLKRDVAKDLPPRLERRVYCDLTPAQRVLYEDIEAQVKSDAQNAQQGGTSKLAILQGLMKLRQVCGHPALLPNMAQVPDESGKLDMFLELLDEVIDGGHRVLVFSQFTSMLAILRKALEAREIEYAYLDGSTQNRQALVHEFNDNENLPVFLISLMAGGTGLNLTGADVVIHFDPWWNPAVEDQATDRAHRIGQEKTVYAMKLITRNTVEARVVQLQDRKRELIEAALGGDEAVMESLSWDDVRELLDL